MPKKIDIFLLIGQSNMVGIGRLDEVPPLIHPDILVFREYTWRTAQEPLHTDISGSAGVGLGMSFGVELLKVTPDIRVGLVPCAVGGSPLSRWMPGADLYNNAVSTTLRALPGGVLKGILWHQGESDSGNPDDARSYGQRFQQMVNSLRSALNAESVPVLAGELGTFLREFAGCPYYNIVNEHLMELEGVLPAYGFVPSGGLTDNGDKLHFNSKSLRDFGIRYAKNYMELIEDIHRIINK
jgi:hypothetical protein